MSTLSLAAAARERPDGVALVIPHGSSAVSMTFLELSREVARFVAVLTASGVGPGSRVAVWAGTRRATVMLMLAAIELGATIVPLHPRLLASEAELLLRAATPARTFLEDDLDELEERAAKSPSVPLAVLSTPPPEAPLAILFTSGTTGRPKGAVLTRAAFLASAAASAMNLPWAENDRWLLAMPLAHIGGLSVLTRSLHARRGMVMLPRFEPEALLDAIASHGVTLFSVVPTMLRRVLETDGAGALSRARAFLVGGAACPPALLEECARRGALALTTYGLTEACSQVTTQRPRAATTTEPGSGHPLPGTLVRCENGRILVRSPTLMSGYFAERPLSQDAWFDTGDLGELDPEGRLHVHARRVDLIVTGGENVYPAEIEAALESYAGVRRAFVFGVPDAEWGELVACAVELDPAKPISEPELHLAVTRSLATFKRPRRICFTLALPTVGDKLDRARAKEMCAPDVRPWVRE